MGYQRRPDLPEEVQALEEKARELAGVIQPRIPQTTGFALLLFDFGPVGHLTWLSNAEREDMLKVLRDMVARLESGLEDTAGREDEGTT